MEKKMVMHNGKVFGVEVSKHGLENGYLDYKTLSTILDGIILNNNIFEATSYEDWEIACGYDEYDTVFQYYIISEQGYEFLQEYTDEIVYYNSELDLYLWGITHFGTSWDYVLTDIKLVDAADTNFRWYNVRLNKFVAEALKLYLIEQHITFEPSECGDLIHFEVKMTNKQRHETNKWLRDVMKGER